jgi:hypothetical protein
MILSAQLEFCREAKHHALLIFRVDHCRGHQLRHSGQLPWNVMLDSPRSGNVCLDILYPYVVLRGYPAPLQRILSGCKILNTKAFPRSTQTQVAIRSSAT